MLIVLDIKPNINRKKRPPLLYQVLTKGISASYAFGICAEALLEILNQASDSTRKFKLNESNRQTFVILINQSDAGYSRKIRPVLEEEIRTHQANS
ncbi:hypothetical protein SADUNF_Sadunf14G0044200 [Salix dunnii]|uniref:Uncharacterized protein n=1 Tax=Salix dunnii TaxID=1413687 RepID=A0A835JG71_9ROSI|nr:hypothetical protein SADUNF_Sadunf14G0044200 [Salix dunnii]